MSGEMLVCMLARTPSSLTHHVSAGVNTQLADQIHERNAARLAMTAGVFVQPIRRCVAMAVL
jgi:hypothetical protein